MDWGFAVCSGVLVSIDNSNLWRILRIRDKDIKVVVSTEPFDFAQDRLRELLDLRGADRAGIHVDPT